MNISGPCGPVWDLRRDQGQYNRGSLSWEKATQIANIISCTQPKCHVSVLCTVGGRSVYLKATIYYFKISKFVVLVLTKIQF